MNFFERKTVGLIFKVKQFVERFFAIKRLDYAPTDIFLYINNIREYHTRAYSCAKEPETIAWIEHYATDKSILYDIGANVGAYSLVAGVRGTRVLAFEPAFQNLYTLSKNITLNRLDTKITSFGIAFSNRSLIDNFVYLETLSGTSRCFYNAEKKFHLDSSNPEIEKGVPVMRLDDFQKIFQLPCPTMLKIDVDGAEAEVLQGAEETLHNVELKTVLIEIDHSQEDELNIIASLNAKGLVHQSVHWRSATTYNHIFVRK